MKQEWDKSFEWTIGNGSGAVKMGMYSYQLRDKEKGTVVYRGVTVAPVAQYHSQGFHDPEQSDRIGFGEERGTAVAVESGSEKPDNLSEVQRNTARAYLEILSEQCSPAELEKMQTAHLTEFTLMRGNPADITAGLVVETPYDRDRSTELHVQWTKELDRDTHKSIAQTLVDKVQGANVAFNKSRSTTESVDWMVGEFEEQADAPSTGKFVTKPRRTQTSSVDRPVQSFTEGRLPEEEAALREIEKGNFKQGMSALERINKQRNNPERAPLSQEAIFDVIADAALLINQHFPGDANDKKRTAFVTDLKKTLEGKNKNGPSK